MLLKFLIFISFVSLLLLHITGCKRISKVDRAAQVLMEGLEQNNKKAIWKMLSKKSKTEWDGIAKKNRLASGYQLFLTGRMWQVQRLRRNYKSPIRIKGALASVDYFDELSRPIQLHWHKEGGKWKFVLSKPFLHSGVQVSSSDVERPSTKPVVFH